MTPDSELLARFARTKSEDAFAELVRRHVNLVYSAALRQVGGDPHLAQDVAQTVFSDLARKAPTLARRATLTGWLYTSARFTAAKTVRTENRRRDREQVFMRQPNDTAPEPEWDRLRPALDEAMHRLKEADREAILLRYFENRPFAEIGARCGLTENAARMRVERALEKLRALLAQRGVTTAAALASVISTHAVQLAPPGLAATLTPASLAGAGAGTLALWNVMNATKLKLGLSALLVAGASTALLVQHHAREQWRAENDSLTRQIEQLKADNQSLSSLAAKAASSQSLPNDQLTDLLRLRNKVGTLRQQTNELGKLRRENQQLQAQLEAESQPTNQLTAEDQFKLQQLHLGDAMQTLLTASVNYAAAHQGQYPANFDQLKASGDLAASTFAGNLGLDDFDFMPPGATNWQGKRLLLRSRVSLQKPDDVQSVRVYGLIDGGPGGVPCVAIYAEVD